MVNQHSDIVSLSKETKRFLILVSFFVRIYLALTVQYQKEDDAAITIEDNITVSCPLMSHGLIDDISVSHNTNIL